jgi:hypothetical protein
MVSPELQESDAMIRITLRLPDEVHRRLVERAGASALSLNQSIVDILSDALGCGKSSRLYETPLEAERRRLRQALGDSVVEYKARDFASALTKWRTPDELDAVLASLQVLHPPLSRTIIEEREETRH